MYTYCSIHCNDENTYKRYVNNAAFMFIAIYKVGARIHQWHI